MPDDDKASAPAALALAPSARSVAARVLLRVAKDGAFAAASLDAELARAVQLEPRDRALATELVYGSLRVLPWLEARLAAHAPRGIDGLDPRARAHLVLATYQLFFLERVPAFAAVNEAVDGVRAASGAKVSGFANAVLRRLAREAATLRAGDPAWRDRVVVDGAAGWLREALGRALGASEVAPYLTSGAGAPPLGLRVENAHQRDLWLERLRSNPALSGARFEAGKASPHAILAWGAGRPASLPGHAEAAFSVQEEGSQVVALALGARAGDTVLDACAGRGNKTAVLARAVTSDGGASPSGAVDAADLHASKLAVLERDLARLGLAARATAPVDWSLGPGPFSGLYDRVLVDAPCSGVGTLRRRPELQTRRTEGDLARLGALQGTILGHAAQQVRPGGTLVYAVCSVLRDEAEDVVARFLSAHPDFTPAPFASTTLSSLADGASTLRLLPHVHGTDGYFLASFTRLTAA